MTMILLNGKKMTSRKETHLYLRRKLNLPSHYGNNLDALWDILSTAGTPIEIVLFNEENMNEGLGSYGKNLINVFLDAADTNRNIKLRIINIKAR